jgi:hypothetical protein
MGLQQAAPMLAPRRGRQNRTKVPKPLCGSIPGIIRRYWVPAPVSDKNELCVAGPCL